MPRREPRILRQAITCRSQNLRLAPRRQAAFKDASRPSRYNVAMAKEKQKPEHMLRITNRRATHDYFIETKVECGVVLVGTEVKSLRAGLGQINDAFKAMENGEVIRSVICEH